MGGGGDSAMGRGRVAATGFDGFVAWSGNHYAVPYDHVTDILPVRITQRELFVYAADLRCVARHELGPRGAGLKLDPAGLHPPPQRRSPVDLDQLHIAFGNIGEGAVEFFRLMSLGPPRVWSAQARQILLLRERYRTDEIDCALGHAAAFGARDHATVERILAARALPRTLDEYVAEASALGRNDPGVLGRNDPAGVVLKSPRRRWPALGEGRRRREEEATLLRVPPMVPA
jgi:hypothetical protein